MFWSAGMEVGMVFGTVSLSPENGATGEQVVRGVGSVRRGGGRDRREHVGGTRRERSIVGCLGEPAQGDGRLAVEHERLERQRRARWFTAVEQGRAIEESSLM